MIVCVIRQYCAQDKQTRFGDKGMKGMGESPTQRVLFFRPYLLYFSLIIYPRFCRECGGVGFRVRVRMRMKGLGL